MRFLRSISMLLLSLGILASLASAKDPLNCPAPPAGDRSCTLGTVTYDWDFAVSTQGFARAMCDEGGASSWQWGSSSVIPDPPNAVWGTIRNGNYANDTGDGLRSPQFLVTAASYLVEVTHFYQMESCYDGGNVSVGTFPTEVLVPPQAGYTCTISDTPSYYAYCVDGEPGFSGASGGWRTDCFDLSPWIGQEVRLQFDFGSDASVTDLGWYLARVVVGGPPAPPAACCDPWTGGCDVRSPAACEEAHGVFHPEWASCQPNPCLDAAPLPALSVATRDNAEPWYDYVPVQPGGGLSLVMALPNPIPHPPNRVDFYYSRDAGTSWSFLGADTDGSEPAFNTVGTGELLAGDGWALHAPVPMELPPDGQPAFFRAVVSRDGASAMQFDTQAVLDPRPPERVTHNLQDWAVVQDSIALYVEPNGAVVEYVIVAITLKDSLYVKGVPGISQHLVSDYHCAPTAVAQCFRYFEQHRPDDEIIGGLSDTTLIADLGVAMNTQWPKGTLLSSWKSGLSWWIANHGDRYTTRTTVHVLEDGTLTWTYGDWQEMRNELEKGQDVLVGVWWPTGGGHAMTLDAIVNPPLPNGRMKIGFKDPWTAATEWGELDANTGWIYNLSGAGQGGYAYMLSTFFVSPVNEFIAGDWLQQILYYGPLPPHGMPIRVGLPRSATAFLHVTAVNEFGHAHTTSTIIQQETASGVGTGPLAAAGVTLGAIAPNPFDASVAIHFDCAAPARLSLGIFDASGRRVRSLIEGMATVGPHAVNWDGRDETARKVAAGVYFVRLTVGGRREAQRLVLMK